MTCQTLRQVAQSVIFKAHTSHLQSLANASTLAFSGALVKDLFAHEKVSPPLLLLTLRHDSRVFEDLQAFRTLLLRCDRIDRVVLRLTSTGDWDPPAHDLGHRWRFLLAEILSIVASKPQAKLMVEGGSSWKSLGRPFHYEFQRTVSRQQSPQARPAQALTKRSEYPCTVPQLFHPLFRLLKGIAARLKSRTKPEPPAIRGLLYTEVHSAPALLRNRKICKITLSSPTLPLLEEFRIQSHILLELPFFNWTLDLLNRSPIKSLYFSNIQLTHYDWEHILSSLTLPHLTTLAFGSSKIAFPDMQAFLARHPTITTLDLSGGTAIGHLGPHSSAHLLPHLNTLIAGPEYLCHFLTPTHAFPHLQSITVTTETRATYHAQDFRQPEPVLCLIAQRPQHNIALTLSLPSRDGLAEWLASVRARLAPVPNVAALDLCLTGDPPSQAALEDLVRFLGVFTSLRALTLREAFFPYWDAQCKMEMVVRLWAEYPGLETVDGVCRP
ncbi:hypothetical protein H0H81_003687 [Sphagnurus paluster]|uniref:Uncharacterized protein n=1 Tax=Sphagnurus paluster TaxID=117069 RepID=A0A9P7K7D2_9AGAR|nr:hypothetical protein H0H81_003687 [Sphagnurus paluster]